MSTEGYPDRCQHCAARISCVFSDLPEEVRREFQQITEVRIYPPGETVVHQGENAHGVWNVRAGAVRLLHHCPCGRAVTLRLVPISGIFGLTEVTTGSPYQASAETVVRSTLEYAPRKAFVDFLLRHSQVTVELLIWLSQEFERLQASLCEAMGSPDLTVRLLDKLREMGECFGTETAEGVELSPLLTGQHLADSLGCSRQWVSKLLGDLERQGRIRRRMHQIIVPTAGWNAGDVH